MTPTISGRPDTPARMAGAELATHRHRLGFTPEDLAEVLDVNPRTIRAWEAGRDPIPYRVPEEIAALIDEHDGVVVEMTREPVRRIHIPRHVDPSDSRPRGWYIAAAARAMDDNPHLEVVWML